MALEQSTCVWSDKQTEHILSALWWAVLVGSHLVLLLLVPAFCRACISHLSTVAASPKQTPACVKRQLHGDWTLFFFFFSGHCISSSSALGVAVKLWVNHLFALSGARHKHAIRLRGSWSAISHFRSPVYPPATCHRFAHPDWAKWQRSQIGAFKEDCH